MAFETSAGRFVLAAGASLLLLVRGLVVMLFALVEPVLRIVLLGVAFLSFWTTIVFGFLMDAPHFPAWGMLAFSLTSYALYGLVLLVQHLLVGLPDDR